MIENSGDSPSKLSIVRFNAILLIYFIAYFIIVDLIDFEFFIERQVKQVIRCIFIIHIGYLILGYLKGSRKYEVLYTIFAALFSSTCLLIILEMFFIFYARSSNFSVSYASHNWQSYYSKINELGYRDEMPKENIPKGVEKVIFVGDSFSAGHGVKLEERFSSIVSNSLGDNYHAYNIAVNGASTVDELRNLRNFVVKDPDIVVLQYFINDISVPKEKLQNIFSNIKASNAFIRFFIYESYFVNFIYYQYSGYKSDNAYIDILRETYANPEGFSRHLKEIEEVIQYTDSKGIKLMAIVFPHPYKVDYFTDSLDKIISNFNDRKIPTIDVRDFIEDIPLKERVVNKDDGHPSPLFHKIVAQKVISAIKNSKNTLK